MKIAYLATHPIQYQAPLLRHLTKNGFDITVFFCSDFSVREHHGEGFGNISIKWDVPLLDGYKHEFLPALGDNQRITFFRPFNYGLRKRLKQEQFDVLWIHGYSRWFHLWSMATAKSLGLKVFIRDEATAISANRNRLKRVAKRLFFFLLDKFVDAFLAIGLLNGDYYAENGIAREKIILVPYTVDNDLFQSQARKGSAAKDSLIGSLGLEPRRPVILYSSKMMRRKCPDLLLEAYIKLSVDGKTEPQPYLIFVGDGEMKTAMQERIEQLHWTSVKFLGFKNQTELPVLYNLADIFVLPSVNEPWGLVVNESMNAKAAVVVSNQVGCAPDLVRSGENGEIFKANDVDELKRAIEQIIKDPSLCKQMGEKSLEIINRWSFNEDTEGLKRALAGLSSGNANRDSEQEPSAQRSTSRL